MQQEISKIRMRKRKRLSRDGSEIDTEAFLEAKLDGTLYEDPLIYRKMRRESGMELLFLADVSGSMGNREISILNHAISDMQFALEPQVKLLVWAYSDFVFPFSRPGKLISPGVYRGRTNTVQALDAAFEWAKNSKSSRAIVLATDGFPTSVRGRRSTGNPMDDLDTTLTEIRSAGVTLSVLCLGAEENRTHFDRAFGRVGYALFQDEASLSLGLLNVARVLVLNHIKKGTR